jgi:NADH-quinone oxidoreductase subunit K
MELVQISAFEYWTHYLALALFGIGLVGFLVRSNALVILMSIELMINAVNVLFVSYSTRMNLNDGIVAVVFIVTIAASEVAVGLGIVLNLYRLKKSVDIDLFRGLRG